MILNYEWWQPWGSSLDIPDRHHTNRLSRHEALRKAAAVATGTAQHGTYKFKLFTESGQLLMDYEGIRRGQES